MTEKDIPREIAVERHGATIKLRRENPHGFIYLRLLVKDKEQPLPEKYQGAYTNLDVAMVDVEHFFEARRRALEETKEEKKVAKAKGSLG